MAQLCRAHFKCPNTWTQIRCETYGFRCPEGSVEEIPCERQDGFYCDGSATFRECRAGTYCPTVSTVLPCTQGHYCPPRSTMEQPCPRGQASEVANATACTPCPLGYSAPETGMTQCTICPAGSYANTFGASACTTCGSGFTSVAGATSSAQCIGSSPEQTIWREILISIPAIGGSVLLFVLGVWLKRRQDDRSWVRFDGYCIANAVRK